MSNFTKIGDYVYMVFNVSSLEDFLENLSEKYLPQILDIISSELSLCPMIVCAIENISKLYHTKESQLLQAWCKENQ